MSQRRREGVDQTLGRKILSCKQNLILAVSHVIMQLQREWNWANAISITTGLVRVVSDRFMQAGSDPRPSLPNL